MKLHFLRVIMLIAISCLDSTAQIVYQSNHYADIGDTFVISHLNTGNRGLGLGATGTDTLWDFSQLPVDFQEVIYYGNPNSSGFQTPYILTCNLECFDPCVGNCTNGGTSNIICQGLCGASCSADCFTEWNDLFDLAEQTNQTTNLSIVTLTDIYNFYQKENNALNQVALGAQIQGLPIILRYGELDRIYSFPLIYGDSDISESDYGISLDSIPGTGIVTSITYKHSQTRSTTVEGWGELITPYMHFDSVLKVRSVIHNRDTIIFQGDTINLQDILPFVLPDTVVEFKWLSKDFGYPVLTATSALINGRLTNQDAKIIDTARCFDPQALFGYLPLVATIDQGEDSVEVNFFSQSVNANTINWNFDDPASGNSNTTQGSNPSHWYTVDGTYNVQMIACNAGCSAVACDTFSLPVIVIDNNPNAIENIDDLTTFNTYPNPFGEVLMIEHLPLKEDVTFEIFDISGKKWMDLPIHNTNHSQVFSIATHYLPNNLYFIRISGNGWSESKRILKVN